ncbi:AAA family ATPase [Actinobacillus equuli subsp. haemolyticus]|uniref:TrlF family AAA-like ATPase n=1 Tax=Actinobacillus equuli TaxID=718 RepID=UPI00244109C2|nr:AAA family ATPase [Actinobacillus equuli]WGE82234.1 AAA family ATPase [Actinobacillus equuli subsp. haemolyticus]
MNKKEQARGSVWNQWDLHIHTPASFHWNGEKFNGEKAHDDALIDEMISALNNAEPKVFAIMDYWTFDGWFKLQQRLKEPNAPKLTKMVFPGIELRLVAPMEGRLNAHVIFSNEIKEQDLKDFRSALQIALIDRPLSDSALIELARKTNHDKLKKHGFRKDDVDSQDDKALEAGSTIAEIITESYKSAISKVPNNQAIGFMPFDTNDGLADIKWFEHYAYVMGLFQSSPIFETRDFDKRCAFVGEITEKNAKYFENFQTALCHIPRLAVSGSDAHCFVGEHGNNDKRGYGDFPSNKRTWIKADPNFRGLKQAILEPAKRSYIGEKPPKLQEIEFNKTFYIDSIQINKTGQKSNIGQWLHGCSIPLNPDLTAIIGNKGSGKSALADVIAMLGNSKQSKYFSFLKKDRFWGKSGEPANNFTGTLSWCDSSEETRLLNEPTLEEKTERVRYIPQGYFEELCNEHISGKSNAFEKELRSVIFSHTNEEMRLGALDFEQLIDRQEQSLRNRLSEYRKDLAKVNEEIVVIEEQLQPIELKKLKEALQLKNKEIKEHEKLKPAEVSQPEATLNENQKQIASELATVNQQLQKQQNRLQEIFIENSELAKQQQALRDIQERLRLLDRSFAQVKQESDSDLMLLGLSWNDIAVLEIKASILNGKSNLISSKQSELKTETENIAKERTQLLEKQKTYTAQLDAPQQQYEAYQRQLAEWQQKLALLIASSTAPETKIGLETRIAQIQQLPSQLNELREKRLKLSGEIFDTLNAQREAREILFKPVQDLIQNNELIREDYRLQFQATLSASSEAISNQLFGLIKQNSGEFRGQDESLAVIRSLYDSYDLNGKEGAINFVKDLFEKIEAASSAGNTDIVGITNILRKDQSANAVYDLLFGLEFLESKYSLVFQDTQIEQLSPGQRGALLLIFYLLVDKGRMPIILDQPEENLDNETVFRLLVPVLSEAKKKRQIIMVTHNPNLAVVCDAEQIIYAHFSRSNDFTISYESGAIENSEINKKVVTVLEGTKPAFDNRHWKYY